MVEFTKRELEIIQLKINEAFHKYGHNLEGIRLLYGQDMKPETLPIYQNFLNEMSTINQKVYAMIKDIEIKEKNKESN